MNPILFLCADQTKLMDEYSENKKMICDIHTHILPGIDDGASDWEMSLAMVKAAAGAKVGMIIATPHYLPWKSDNHTEQIEPLCRELMYRSKKFLDTDITILPGQEIFYHQDLLEELQNGTGSRRAWWI